MIASKTSVSSSVRLGSCRMAHARPLAPKASRINSVMVKAGCDSHKPLVGGHAPDFKAQAVFDQEFIDVTLSQYKGKKYVVLFFYPLDFTFVCPTEITAFSDRYKVRWMGG